MSDELQTAAQWCRKIDHSILDPDGWRYENGSREFFETPITFQEFQAKLSRCTGKPGFEQKFEDRLRQMMT